MAEPDIFALCDDSGASDALPRSRLYTGYIERLQCHGAEDFPAMLDAMQHALAHGLHAVALLSYELGADLQGIGDAGKLPAAATSQVLLFRDCTFLSAGQADAWLEQRADPARPAGIAQVRANVDEAQFHAALDRIHAYIEAGDTYQINYTYRLRFDAYGSIFSLYRQLRRRQPVPYGALIGLPGGESVLSLSPELFIRAVQGQLTARPMKGTAAAGSDDSENVQRAAGLAADPKNRAENLMIVDLLRNDLGRVAETGSVQVSKLFDVTRYADVLQMTSTVQACLRPELGLAQVMRALFPCGSITGAPKHRSMQIIRELELAPRGWYTGAIGWFDAAPEDRTVGDFCLSVPIRTLVLQAPQQGGLRDGLRSGEMGVGAGIVFDSDSKEEFEECSLKARFLTGLPHGFDLFETMHATREEGCRHLHRHLQRLKASADYFGFSFNETRIIGLLRDACAKLPAGTPHRFRLALSEDGALDLQPGQLTTLTTPVKLLLADRPVEADALFLKHKTTVRADYDASWRAAESQGAFDTIFCNARGELTEGGRTNLFLKIDGRWFTPPLSSGVLPGIMRAVLLDDPAWAAGESALTIEHLHSAEQIVVCNSLRGALNATLL
ncbi:MAG TPA: chorismate-binding protein [Burkholderiaceae bacterium]|jgi:para-aminobenzoate synthetase/4-amino-4-deoxychorismate lyase